MYNFDLNDPRMQPDVQPTQVTCVRCKNDVYETSEICIKNELCSDCIAKGRVCPECGTHLVIDNICHHCGFVYTYLTDNVYAYSDGIKDGKETITAFLKNAKGLFNESCFIIPENDSSYINFLIAVDVISNSFLLLNKELELDMWIPKPLYNYQTYVLNEETGRQELKIIQVEIIEKDTWYWRAKTDTGEEIYSPKHDFIKI